jgi:hypothetical protein
MTSTRRFAGELPAGRSGAHGSDWCAARGRRRGGARHIQLVQFAVTDTCAAIVWVSRMTTAVARALSSPVAAVSLGAGV